MTNYDNALGSLASGGPGAVRYDGDALINDEKHQFCIDLAAQLEHDTELIQFPSDVGSGATIVQAEERINKLRGRMLKMADGLRTIGDAAKDAAPPIRVGTAADPEVQSALERSSAAYKSVEEVVPPESDDSISGRPGPDKDGGRSGPEEPAAADASPPRTRTSADGAAAPAAAAAAPAGQGQMAAPMQGAQMPPQAPMAGPAAGGGGPAMAPAALNPGGSSGAGTTPQQRRRDNERQDGTTLAGGGLVAAPMATAGNPSVNGARVDPGQIGGRTASTSPSSGAAPLKMGPSAPTGMMGGMGGMPMGGGMGNGAAGARTDMPQPRRDRASERILTGEEARDKAFVSHILRDDDPIAGEYVDNSAELADLLPDERNPRTASSNDSDSPVVMDIPAAAPVVMNVPPPPPPRPIGFAPTQYPGEPREDEKW